MCLFKLLRFAIYAATRLPSRAQSNHRQDSQSNGVLLMGKVIPFPMAKAAIPELREETGTTTVRSAAPDASSHWSMVCPNCMTRLFKRSLSEPWDCVCGWGD